jgi:hypothetical protein
MWRKIRKRRRTGRRLSGTKRRRRRITEENREFISFLVF